MQTLCRYFPGGNTPDGFFSYYNEILDKTTAGKLAVIKGGPGTGKSTFLKHIGKTLSERGKQVTCLHCSSDPNSLDGIFLPEHNSLLMDGTAPHMTDVRYPGAYDIVLNFCDFIGEIADKETVLRESTLAKSTFSEGYCYLRSAKALLELMHTRSEQTLLEDEIRLFASDIAKRISSASANGYQKTVFLSAITADGFCNYLEDNLKDYHIISLDTRVGDAAYRVMETVQSACSLRNADMIVCPCPMNPEKTEHLLFPSANLALVTSNPYHTCRGADEIVSFSDFITSRRPCRTPEIMIDGILQLAVQTFFKAREHHNRLEELYQAVTDYSKIDRLYQKALDFLLDS